MLTLDNSIPCPECGRFANRGVTIDAVIIRAGQILLIKRGVEPFKGYWALCGGYVSWDETVEEAVRREVMEELQLTVVSLEFIDYYSDPSRHPKQAINFAFLAHTNGIPIASDDATEFKFFDLDSLPEQLAFDHKKIIADCQRRFL